MKRAPQKLDRGLASLGSPTGVMASLLALLAALALQHADPAGGPTLVRFCGVVLAGVGLLAAYRFLAEAPKRGGLGGGWRPIVHRMPLPFFDEEMGSGSLREFRAGVVARGVVALLIAVSAFGVWSVVAALETTEFGVIDAVPDASVESWTDVRVGVQRDFGFRLRVREIGSDSIDLRLDRTGSDWQRDVTLAPLESVRLAGFALRWIGTTATEELGGLDVELVDADGATIGTATLRPGSPHLVADHSVTWMESDPNRLGTLGPAAQIRVQLESTDPTGGGLPSETFWLHARSPNAHVLYGESEVGVRLIAFDPSVVARLEVRSFASPAFAGTAAVIGVVFMLGLLLVWRHPVWVRGRSGDYELVVVRPSAAQAQRLAAGAARRLLGDAELAEWHALSTRHAPGKGR